MANVNFPLTFSLAPIPTGSALSADEFGQQLVANLQAFISGNFLTGQIGGTQPTQNVGPWLNGTTWWFWNPVLNTYAPIPVHVIFSPIHNALMQIWQRGTTFTTITGSSYVADRYIAAETLVTGVASVSRKALNLPGTSTYPDTAYGLRITVTTAQTTIGANEVFSVYQLVERLNARPLFDGSTSLSLVLQASVAGTYCVALRDAGTDFSYVMECVVTSPNVPQAFTFPSIPPFPTATGNWGTLDTDACYSLTVSAACGFTYQTLSNVWSVGNFVGTTNQTNLFSTLGNTLDITLIQHETGTVCNPFIFTPFDEDLQKCQRYYTKSQNYGTSPNQFALVTSDSTASGNVLTFASTTGASTNSTVSVGMVVFGLNISLGSFVTAVTPTTVTLNAPVLSAIAIDAGISFVSGASTVNEIAFNVLSTTQAYGNARFPVKMRTTPSLFIWTILYGQTNAVYSVDQSFNIGGVSTVTLGDMGFDVVQTTSTWSTAPNIIRFHYTASADL